MKKKEMTPEELMYAKTIFMLHLHQCVSWAEFMKADSTGEIKYRINGGLGHFQKLVKDFEKDETYEMNDFIYERGNAIGRLLSCAKDDPGKYNEIIDLIQLHLDGALTITGDEDKNGE